MESSQVSNKLVERVTWRNIARVQQAARWTDVEMAERLGLTVREFLKHRATHRPVRIAPLIALASSLDVSADSFLFGKLDYVALEKHLNGDWSYIPEKYTANAKSNRDMARNLLSYNSQKNGLENSVRLLRKFQVTYSGIMSGSTPVNLRLSTEIATSLSENGEDPVKIGLEIGSNASTYFQGTDFQKLLLDSQPNSILEVFATAGKLAPNHLEKNLSWSVKKSHAKTFTFVGEPNDEVFQNLESDLAQSRLASGVRLGFMYALPKLARSKNFFQIQVKKCLSLGDPIIEYEILWA